VTSLWNKYGVKQRSKLLDGDVPEYERITLANGLSVELAQNLEEKGKTHVHYVDGLPDKSKSADFGYRARGVKGKPGVYWDVYEQDGLVGSSVDSAHEGLVSGQWNFGLPKDTPDTAEQRLAEQAVFLQKNLLSKPSSWKQFLKNWCLADRLYGFGLWNIVDREDGGIKKLAWRDPSTVNKWVFDEPMREWLATRFKYRDDKKVDISAENLLLYSTGTGDTDPEGLPPVRRCVRWVEIKQLVAQIEVAAAEAHGTGYVSVSSVLDEDEQKELKDIFASATATDIPVIVVPDGYEVAWLSPQGKLPDFDTMKRFCDEQISLALQSTGSLVGLGDTGTYNLAETKDEQENIRRIRFYGQSVCDLINEYIVPRVVENAFGGPVRPGLYPQLGFTLASEAKDPERYDRIGTFVERGVLTWRRKDENKIRAEMDLDLLPEESGDEDELTDDQLV
jgi:hypothetical protein